jgi:hypothetical protein
MRRSGPSGPDVKQLEVTDSNRERRIDDEVLADGLEPEHRPQEE